MTLRLGKSIVQSNAGAIQSFDFYDLASGRGSTTLYCGDFNRKLGYPEYSGADGYAPDYKMSNIKWYSDQGYIFSGASATLIGFSDIKFDMDINKPIVMDGLGIVNVPIIQRNNQGSPFNMACIVLTDLYRVKSGTEIFIASGASRYDKSVADGAAAYHIYAQSLNIPTTKLVTDDILRLRVRFSGAQMYCIMGCDPMGRTSKTEIFDGGGTNSWGTTTALTFNMPLRIDAG